MTQPWSAALPGPTRSIRAHLAGRVSRPPRLHAHVFCGPTLDHGEARRILQGATIHPPVARNDLSRLRRIGQSVVVLIDSATHEAPSAAPSEIVRALAAGARVYGAGGMGALLAVDFGGEGMLGSGVVHLWAREGVLLGMDEVIASAVPRVGAAERCAVNLRHALSLAVAAGVVDPEESDRVLRAYRRLPARERSLRSVDGHDVDGRVLERLRRFVGRRGGACDVMRQDARRLLLDLRAAYAWD